MAMPMSFSNQSSAQSSAKGSSDGYFNAGDMSVNIGGIPPWVIAAAVAAAVFLLWKRR